jgi:superfamily II DNA helicase RecQ
MREIWKLVLKEVQMVFLTAILPPYKEQEFMDIFRVTIEEKNKFRAATTQPKIEYSVQEYEGREIEAVGQLVEEKCKQYPAPAKIIIYSSTIEGTKQLREKLGCHAYYRAVDDTEAKDEIRKQWQSADG